MHKRLLNLLPSNLCVGLLPDAEGPSRFVCAGLWSLELAAMCSTGPFDPMWAVSLGLVLSAVLSALVAARALQMGRLPG